MTKLFTAVFALMSLMLVAAPASADQQRDTEIKRLFTAVNNNPKGALSKNSYQRPATRTDVLQDSSVTGAPRDTYFTAAFRNETADALAKLGVYTGNRFASNYWELHNKYLATPQEQRALAFRQDHPRFMATPQIAPDAYLIAKNMLLEAFYMQKNPASRLTRANQQRGTADADNEKTYYGMLVQYLAKYAANGYDYLTVFEVQRRFNLTGDTGGISLQNLRDTVAGIYDELAQDYPNTQLQVDFYIIRNSIHNYMTPDVLTKLNAFLSAHERELSNGGWGGWGGGSGNLAGRIRSLRDNVAAYYRTDKKVLVTGVRDLGAALPAEVAAAVNPLLDKGNSYERLEQFSWSLTKARESFLSSRNHEIIHFLIKATRFIQTELASRQLRGDEFAIRGRIALDCAYVQGFVAPADWASVRTSLTNIASNNNADALRSLHQDLVRVISNSPVLLRGALNPALEDWAKLDRPTEGAVDDSLRSSMMSEINNVTVVLKSRLPASATKYVIENEGETYGYLVYVPTGATEDTIQRLEKTSIPVFAELPLDLGVVAGIITEQPQTPLSHVNIKSKARGTPNVYYPKASTEAGQLRDLILKKALVRMTLKDGVMTVREASLEEARMFWARMHAPAKVEIKADLSEKRLRSTKELGSKDVLTVGAKAANYGEASKVIDPKVMLEAYSIPFFYYKEYIDTAKYDANQTFSQRIKAMLADPKMNTDRGYRIAQLADLQERMSSKDNAINPELLATLQKWADTTYPGRTLKFRSSTNSEDLANFSGAGLYDSYAYDPEKPKKSIANVLRKTWASVWNLRAFDEREHFGIPHADVYMAILVSPGFPTETANGVAVTRNIKLASQGSGVYINTQAGEDAVTNPDPKLIPEELTVLFKQDTANKLPYTLKYMKYSSLSPGKPILTNQEVVSLTQYLMKIHAQFKKVFDPQNKNAKFAVDVEWKINMVDGARQIFIKQARPYVD